MSMRLWLSLLLSTGILTGLHGSAVGAAEGLTYSLRSEQTTFYTEQLAAGAVTLTVPMYIAKDPGTAGINAAFLTDAPLEITELSFGDPYCYGSGRAGADAMCRVTSRQSAKLLWYTSNNGANEVIFDETLPFAVLQVVIPGDTPAGTYTISLDPAGTEACSQDRTILPCTLEDLTLTVLEGKPAYLRGDADGNGTVEVADAVEVLQYCAEAAAGAAPVRSYAWLCGADATENGGVEVADAVAILQYCAGRLTDPKGTW